MGSRAHPGRAEVAGHPGQCHDDQKGGATRRPGSCPQANRSPWSEFLRAQAKGMIACDFFCVETIRLKTLYVLMFIELQTRRVLVTASTAHPGSAWVSQQTRNLSMDLDGRAPPLRFLIHDRDSKFSGSFDEVFRSEGARVILTPIRAPNANAFAERWVRTVRADCLDWMLILGRRHRPRAPELRGAL
jgi:putative transposase